MRIMVVERDHQRGHPRCAQPRLRLSGTPLPQRGGCRTAYFESPICECSDQQLQGVPAIDFAQGLNRGLAHARAFVPVEDGNQWLLCTRIADPPQGSGRAGAH